MSKRLLIINGPGLATGAPGSDTATDDFDPDDLGFRCEDLASGLGFTIELRQTDDQNEFHRWILQDGVDFDGLIVNPAAPWRAAAVDPESYRAALRRVTRAIGPVIEVHLDNVFHRPGCETRPAYDTRGSTGIVCGFGTAGYALAIRALARRCESADSPHTPAAEAARNAGTRSLHILNGPNLNLLGTREPGIYGHKTLDDIAAACAKAAAAHGVDTVFRQSNYEGELVDWIQQAIGRAEAIIINAAAYTHTSIAIHDALRAFDGYKVELHISNPHAREPFRHVSYVASAVHAVVAGLGPDAYELVTDLLAGTKLDVTEGV